MEVSEAITLLFKSVNLLISPPVSKPVLSSDTSEELLDSVLQRNLAAFHHFLGESPGLQDVLGDNSLLLLQNQGASFLHCPHVVPVRHKFVEVCICLLQHVCDKFTLIACQTIQNKTTNVSNCTSVSAGCETTKQAVPVLRPDAMSIQQEKVISSAVQFVVVLGICPYLVPGVGMPVSQRLGPGQILLATGHDYTTELNDLNRIQLLVPAVKLFFSMLSVPALKDIVLKSYLSDLLAATLQVRNCAKTILQRNQVPKEITTTSSSADCVSHVTVVESGNESICQDGPKQHKSVRRVTENVEMSQRPEMFNCSTAVFPRGLPDVYLDTLGQPWTLQSIVEVSSRIIDRVVTSSPGPHILTQLVLLSGGGQSSSGSRPVIPKWFRRSIACLLRDIIMAPPGVHHLITAFVEDSSSVSPQDWQRCRAVAQIISRCPVTPGNIRQFYTSVSTQLIELVQTAKAQVSPHVLRAVGAAIQELTSQQPDLMQDVCISHLLSPLLRLSRDRVDMLAEKDGQMIVSEETLTHCIVVLHRIFVIGQEPQSSLLSQLRQVVRILFFLYTFTRSSVTVLRTQTRDLIKAYLGQCETAEAAACLISLVSNRRSDCLQSPMVSDNVVLESGPEGGLHAVFIKDKQFEADSWTQPVASLMDILSGLNSDAITSQLFLCLLQNLTDIVSTETADIGIILPPRLMPMNQQAEKLSEVREKIALVSLLASLGDEFGDKVIQSSHHVLLFVKATLERCVKIYQLSHDAATLSFEEETVSMAMGLLTAMLSGAVMLSDTDKKILDEILPLLNLIADNENAALSVKEMADDLKVAVATRGLVWAEISKLKAKRAAQNRKPKTMKPEHIQHNKPLIEVLSETVTDDSTVMADETVVTKLACESDSAHGESKQAGVSLLEKALQDLCDPLLPVKGHGLISLTRMIEVRDQEVKDKHEVLLKIFLDNMAHTDSYIYLAAVNGLAALSDVYPDQVIPCLTSEFRSICVKTQSSRSEETALKVGESLVKATKRLGELTPKYRDQLLPVMLCGCRHDFALVRASSLSGLADTCKLLRFSVGPLLHEIVTCCKDVINSDPYPEPRKAAILTLTLLLQGLGRDIVLALGDVLLDIYRVLKHSFTFDPDEKVRLNANLALGELDDIMRETLFSKPELKKTITILGYQ